MPLTRALITLAALLLAACGPGIKLPVKSTPAATRIALEVKIDPKLVAAVKEQRRREAVEGLQTGGLTPANLMDAGEAIADKDPTATWTADLLAKLRAGVLDHKVGIPTGSGSADLVLRGTLRRASDAGVAFDWTLTEPKTQTVVATAVAEEYFYSGDAAFLTRKVLAKLLVTDVDRWSRAERLAPKPPSPGPPPSVAPLDPPEASTDGRAAFALVVGVERYRDALPPATHAEADARAFASYARKTLGVPEAHVKLLLGERAGLADLASAIEEWLPRNAREPKGRVYVFFSGHGAPDPETGEAYLVPYDADPAYLKTRGYAVRRLVETLGRLTGQQVLLFTDACFTGSGPRSVLAAGTRPLVPVKPTPSARGVVSFAAAGAREATGAARDTAHGLFTHRLLEALGGAADADADHAVTLAEVAEYVTARVSADARLDNREQTPTLTLPPGLTAAQLTLVDGLRR